MYFFFMAIPSSLTFLPYHITTKTVTMHYCISSHPWWCHCLYALTSGKHLDCAASKCPPSLLWQMTMRQRTLCKSCLLAGRGGDIHVSFKSVSRLLSRINAVVIIMRWLDSSLRPLAFTTSTNASFQIRGGGRVIDTWVLLLPSRHSDKVPDVMPLVRRFFFFYVLMSLMLC